MREFASGVRNNAVMSPVAKALSPDDVADVSAYYATVNAPYLPLATADPTLIKRGEELAKVGSAVRQIPGCDNCHGPGGAGEPPAIPYLAGQYASYIAMELRMWQRGFRTSSSEVMAPIAKQLDDQEIAAVSAFYQQIQGSVASRASQ
jgi:cytochrome c553